MSQSKKHIKSFSRMHHQQNTNSTYRLLERCQHPLERGFLQPCPVLYGLGLHLQRRIRELLRSALCLAKLFAPQKMRKGARRAPKRPPARRYAGRGVSPEVKEHTASFAVALQARGVPLETIVKSLSDTAYAPARRTLLLHMAAIKGGMAPLSSEKGGYCSHGRVVGRRFWLGFAPTKNGRSRDCAAMDQGQPGH